MCSFVFEIIVASLISLTVQGTPKEQCKVNITPSLAITIPQAVFSYLNQTISEVAMTESLEDLIAMSSETIKTRIGQSETVGDISNIMGVVFGAVAAGNPGLLVNETTIEMFMMGAFTPFSEVCVNGQRLTPGNVIDVIIPDIDFDQILNPEMFINATMTALIEAWDVLIDEAMIAQVQETLDGILMSLPLPNLTMSFEQINGLVNGALESSMEVVEDLGETAARLMDTLQGQAENFSMGVVEDLSDFLTGVGEWLSTAGQMLAENVTSP